MEKVGRPSPEDPCNLSDGREVVFCALHSSTLPVLLGILLLFASSLTFRGRWECRNQRVLLVNLPPEKSSAKLTPQGSQAARVLFGM